MLNRVVLMGRLVADPELKNTANGTSVTSFRLAVDRSFVKSGEERQADFFDVVAWRGTAEFVCKHFRKGNLIAIDGQLQSRTYQAKDGSNRHTVEVVADNVFFTGERRDAVQQGEFTPADENHTQANFEQMTGTQQEFATVSDSDDDLPF